LGADPERFELMARYFAGNTLANFLRNSANVIEITTAGRFDSAFVPNAISIPGSNFGNEYVEARLNADATGNVWVHFEAIHGTINQPAANCTFIKFFNSAGVEVFRVITGTGTLQGQIWSGSAWVNSGSAFVVAGGLQRFDVRFAPGNGGSFDFYVAGAPVGSGAGHVVAGGVLSDVRTIRIASFSTAVACQLSQMLVADFDTRESRYRMPAINANGALTDGVGGFADIAEIVLDESTAIKLTAAAQRKTFTKAAIAVPTGYRIAAMVIGARGRVTGALTDGRLLARVGGANYASSNRGFNGGYEPRTHILEANPATASDWNEADFNAAEIGVEAA
jgi:hypothetical protein